MPLANPELTEFTTTSPAIATFDALELSTGTMYRDFYLNDDEQPTYNLSANVFYSQEGQVTISGAEKNFDLLTETSFEIGGPTIVNLGFLLRNQTGTQTVASTITVRVIHVAADSTETSLGTASKAYSQSLGVATLWQNFAAVIDTTNKVFGRGESLRLEVVATDPGTSRSILLGCDPANRLDIISATWVYSNSKIILPIKIN